MANGTNHRSWRLLCLKEHEENQRGKQVMGSAPGFSGLRGKEKAGSRGSLGQLWVALDSAVTAWLT